MQFRHWIVVYCLATLAIVSVFYFSSDSQETALPQSTYTGDARIETHKGIRVMHLYGNPESMGRQHGRLLKEEIHLLVENYLNKFLNAEERKIGLHTAKSFFLPNIPEAYLSEMRGLSESSGVDFDTVLLAQCFLDIGRVLSCSTVAIPGDQNALGESMLLRNLDFPGLGLAEKHSLIIVRHYNEDTFTVSVGWPLLLGTLSGFNSDGLAIAMMESYSKGNAVKGMPYNLRFRDALEQCARIPDLKKYFNNVAITSANNLTCIDKTGDNCVFELSSKGIAIRHETGKIHFATNHFVSQQLSIGARCDRYNLIQKTMSSAHYERDMDLKQAEVVLDQIAIKHLNLQSFVLLPKSRRIHISLGKVPACSGPFVTLGPKELQLGTD